MKQYPRLIRSEKYTTGESQKWTSEYSIEDWDEALKQTDRTSEENTFPEAVLYKMYKEFKTQPKKFIGYKAIKTIEDAEKYLGKFKYFDKLDQDKIERLEKEFNTHKIP